MQIKAKRTAGLAGCAASGTVFIISIRTACTIAGIVLIAAISTAPVGHNYDRVILGSELCDQGVHVVVHPVRQVVLDDPGHGGYGGVEVKMRFKVEEVTEDA